MPRLTIDNRAVEVDAGATVLAAARKLGIEIPTLCYLEPLPACTSCMVCLVKVRGQDGFKPACATPAEESMAVESETAEIRQARQAALELLLSDHLGDCMGPCQVICPAGMNIPLMIRQIAAGQLDDAIATVKRDIALPAVLGRICPAPCEKGCRRRQADSAVAICLLKRYVADVDLAKNRPYLPPRRPKSGKRVAIVGAGPAGLSAAFYLLEMGHGCAIFDERDEPGGALRYAIEQERLPREVLDAEIAVIEALDAEFRPGVRVGGGGCPALEELRDEFDAVLLAVGKVETEQVERLGLATCQQGITADRRTYAASAEGVFAAGSAIRAGNKLAVRSAADGKEAAASIDQYLTGKPVTGPPRPFNTHIGRVPQDELSEFLRRAAAIPRIEPAGGLSAGLSQAEARDEGSRCLHCDCRKADGCKLRRCAARYQVSGRRYASGRRAVEIRDQHPEIIYEPGKCIACGLCVEICRRARERLGLTFVGRGFDVRIGVPFNAELAEGLQKAAAECVAACPTGALAPRDA